ncbi:MAG: phosphotransferase [Rhizomicrobium sp.]
MGEIPILRPEAVTPEWLTNVLARGGVDAEVRGFTSKSIGTGQIGQSVKFTIDYVRAGGDAPKSLVGKFPSPGEESRNTGIALGNYVREVNFYRTLAPTALISLPKCYFTDVDPATSEFVLMMEDLSPAEQGDQLTGCTLEQARLAMREAANLAASHWGDASIEDYAWVSGTKAAASHGSADAGQVVALWQAFCARYEARLDDECWMVGDVLSANYPRYPALFKGPKALAHNDFRPDNMMFASAAGGRPLTVLDWQSVSFGCAATDVAYFLGGSLPREVRRAREHELVQEYFERLKDLGVRDYTFEQLWNDYRGHTFQLFLTAFYAAMIVTQTARGDDMFFAMLRGAADQILDQDSLSFIR